VKSPQVGEVHRVHKADVRITTVVQMRASGGNAMTQIPAECEELRVNLERLRALLDSLVVRGLRACGPDEMAQLRSYTDHLERSGAGHVAAALTDLQSRIQKDDRSSAATLLTAQTSVRLLERLLTLRVVRAQFESATAEPGEDETGDTDGA
jgi:hypothetical protein